MWSGIPWCTEMKFDGQIVMIKLRGRWIKLTDLNENWKKFENDQKKVFETIVIYYRELYPDGKLPNAWVFNDFGHISIKYFSDNNNDRKMNGKEKIMGDFIHTTPQNEAETARNNNIKLEQSHGCIHVKPNDIDALIGNGYVKVGYSVEVHSYNEKTIHSNLKRDTADLPFETHFYPSLYKLVVYKKL